MSEERERELNIEPEASETQGLDQDKFADLFDSLDEETLMKMMERAGLTDEDVDAVPDEPQTESADEEEPLIIKWLEPDATEVSAEAVSDTAVSVAAAEASPETVADKEAMLSPEHIGHMLSVLGDDIIGDMLDSAGLTNEDVDAVLAEAKAERDTAEVENGTAAPDAGKKPAPLGKRRKGKNVRRLLFVLIFIGILGLVAAVNKIYNSVTINSNDPIQYSEHTDEIYAEEGTLHVNNVSVTVPTNGAEEYSISYSWSEKDSKYPSVPHAITAIYSKRTEQSEESEEAGENKDTEKAEKTGEDKAADEGEGTRADAEAEEKAADADIEDSEEEDIPEAEKLYSITLYRNETTPSKEIAKGKKVDNWFDDWTVVNEGDVLQIPLRSGSINGFYIFPQPPSDNGSASDYNDFSYYFAIKDDEGISTYVIEGVCLDPERDDEFRSIMDNCIHSISIDSEDDDPEADDSETDEDNKKADTEQ